MGDNRTPRGEWSLGGHHLTGIAAGPWVCDCVDYGLAPQPNGMGECQTCYRPVYDDDGKRVTR